MNGYQALTDRIVTEALAECRQRAVEDEVASRCHEVCDDAVHASRSAFLHLLLGHHEGGLRGRLRPRLVLLADQDADLVWVGP